MISMNSLLAFLAFISLVYGFGFTVDPSSEKCFFENIEDNTLVKGTYLYESGSKIAVVTVKDPNDKIIYTDIVSSRGKFVFNSEIEGNYKICFSNKDTLPANLILKFRYGIDAKDYSHLAQVQNLEPIEVQMQWIVDSLAEVDESTESLQDRENQIRELSAKIDQNIFIFGIITIVLLVILSVSQTMMLKRRLKKAKIF